MSKLPEYNPAKAKRERKSKLPSANVDQRDPYAEVDKVRLDKAVKNAPPDSKLHVGTNLERDYVFKVAREMGKRVDVDVV